jgi:O-antigen ligase
MPMTAYVLFGLAFVVLAVLPAVPLPIALVGLVALRTFTDLGAPTSGSVLPSSTLSAAIGGALVLLALLSSRGAPPLPRTVRRIAWAFGILVLIWTIVGLIQFGGDGRMLQESLRLVSVLAALLCMVRVMQSRTSRLSRTWPVVIVVPSALALLLLYAIHSPLADVAGRAAGTFSHSNAAAAFFAAGTLVLGGEYFRRRSPLLLVAGIGSAVALLATQSIGSTFGLIAGALVMALFRPGVRLSVRIFGAVLTLGAAALAVTLSPAGDRVQEFSQYDPSAALATGTSSDSLEWRLINWSDLLAIWQQSPIFGYGVGSTASQVQPLNAPPHSMPIQLLVELGLLGTLFAVILLVYAIRRVLAAGVATYEARLMLGLVVFGVVTGSESNLMDYTSADYLLALAAGSLITVAMPAGTRVAAPVRKWSDEVRLASRPVRRAPRLGTR